MRLGRVVIIGSALRHDKMVPDGARTLRGYSIARLLTRGPEPCPTGRDPPNPPSLTACPWDAPGDVSFVGLDNHEPGLDGTPLAATPSQPGAPAYVFRVNCGEHALSSADSTFWPSAGTRLLGDELSGNTVAG